MILNSRKYPNITYERGREIFLLPDEPGRPFYFDVASELTGDSGAMAAVASALDELDPLEQAAKAFLKTALSDKDSEYYKTAAGFMEFHRDELEPAAVRQLFSVEDPSALSLDAMVDCLRVKRFGSLIDSQLAKQLFIMDLCFDPDVTDELMVVYFDLQKQIVVLAHES